MQINDAGLDLIKSFERLMLVAYDDGTGVWTIGYGHTRDVQKGDTTTELGAENYLLEDLAVAEAGVNRAIEGSRTTDNQYAAMVSLTFNIGVGAGFPPSGFVGSSVLRLHKRGLYSSAADAFLVWNKVHINGVLRDSAGLLRRRKAESALYLRPETLLAA